MCTLENSEGPDKMLHNAAFHQGLHCLLRLKQFSEKEIQFYLEIITCYPLIYTMDLSKLIVSKKVCFIPGPEVIKLFHAQLN